MKEGLKAILTAGKKLKTSMVISTFLALVLLLSAVLLGACTAGSAAASPSSLSPAPTGTSTPVSPTPSGNSTVVYSNTDYGFDFTLPIEWKNYTIVTDTWKGTPLTEGGKEESGPQLLLRSPKWTEAAPTQDIPIMVFTVALWDALQHEEFSVSAAPIPPSELGRNNKFVFALPARYNFAYLPGYEEVEDILNGKPLQAYDIK